MEQFLIMYAPPLVIIAALAFVFLWSGRAENSEFTETDVPSGRAASEIRKS